MSREYIVRLKSEDRGEGAPSLEISSMPFVIGTDPMLADLKIPKTGGVEGSNSRIDVQEGRVQIRNTTRSNPTFINGKKVSFWRRLREGDTVAFGMGDNKEPLNPYTVESIEETTMPEPGRRRTRTGRSPLGTPQITHYEDKD